MVKLTLDTQGDTHIADGLAEPRERGPLSHAGKLSLDSAFPPVALSCVFLPASLSLLRFSSCHLYSPFASSETSIKILFLTERSVNMETHWHHRQCCDFMSERNRRNRWKEWRGRNDTYKHFLKISKNSSPSTPNVKEHKPDLFLSLNITNYFLICGHNSAQHFNMLFTRERYLSPRSMRFAGSRPAWQPKHPLEKD